jgi:hypothetical protein
MTERNFFPPPTGPYEIGTLTYHWVDTQRGEVFSPDAHARRELMVQIWYPGEGGPGIAAHSLPAGRRCSYGCICALVQ